MTRDSHLQHEFVESFPKELEQGVVYVSMLYGSAAHRCCCGCGNKVITPLSPRDWKLIYDGETISLHPSIGNWSFPCQSHYWIRNGQVDWAPQWSKGQIEANREYRFSLDRDDAAAYAPIEEEPAVVTEKVGFWKWLGKLVRRNKA